eukprot:GEMP01083481.1.p1 GENE.GEMP01083481.1~~GEMP01083481.1.p1  ORF type:complete len:193 (+),score=31.73 GEMP01083481.1:109-687(+)
MDLSREICNRSNSDLWAPWHTPRKLTGASPVSTASTRPSSSDGNLLNNSSARPSFLRGEGGAPIRPRACQLKPHRMDGIPHITPRTTDAAATLSGRTPRPTDDIPLTARTPRDDALHAVIHRVATIPTSPAPQSTPRPSCSVRDGRFSRRPVANKEPAKDADPLDVLDKRREVNTRGRSYVVWSFKRPRTAA